MPKPDRTVPPVEYRGIPLYTDATASAGYRPLVGFDFETGLILPGRLTPRAVCLSLYGVGAAPASVVDLLVDAHAEATLGAHYLDHGGTWEAVLGRDTMFPILLALLLDPGVVLIGHNTPFDLGVFVAGCFEVGCFEADPWPWSYRSKHGLGPQALDAVCGALDAGRIVDTLVRDKLIDVAFGQMHKGRRYRLADLVQRRFGEALADKDAPPCSLCAGKGTVPQTVPKAKGEGFKAIKVPCSACGGSGEGVQPWRMRYHELDGVPIPDYPPKALTYSVEDSQWALLCAVDQGGAPGAVLATVEGDPVANPDGSVVDEFAQTWASWSLHLQAVWGLRTEQGAADRFTAETLAAYTKGVQIGIEAGFVESKRKTCSACRARLEGAVACPACGAAAPTKITRAKLQALVVAAYARDGRTAPRTPPSKTHPEGQVQYGEDSLREARDALLDAYADSLEAKTNQEKYVRFVHDGVRFAMTSKPGTIVSTGRTSWAKPPLQQPPREGGFRECFVPRPGFVYISVDWSGAELVMLAQILVWMFGASAMAEALNRGDDLHVGIAAQILGITYAEAFARYKAGDPEVKRLRQEVGKPLNFGAPGGLGAKSFVAYARSMAGVRLTEREARDYLDTFKATWPEIVDYFQFFGRAAGRFENGFVFRQFVSGRQRGDVSYTSGCNTGFQGGVSEALKLSLRCATRACYLPTGGYREGTALRPHEASFDLAPVLVRGPVPTGKRSPLYGCRPVLSVHDELIVEAPSAYAAEAAHALSVNIMIPALRYYCPDLAAAVRAEPALMRRWYKGAGTVRDEQGRLVPWEPSAKA